MAERIKWSKLNAETLNFVALLYTRLENLKNEEDYCGDIPLFPGSNADCVDAMIEGFGVEL